MYRAGRKLSIRVNFCLPKHWTPNSKWKDEDNIFKGTRGRGHLHWIPVEREKGVLIIIFFSFLPSYFPFLFISMVDRRIMNPSSKNWHSFPAISTVLIYCLFRHLRPSVIQNAVLHFIQFHKAKFGNLCHCFKKKTK